MKNQVMTRCWLNARSNFSGDSGQARQRGPAPEERRRERQSPEEAPQTPGMARFNGRSTRTSRNAVASDIDASTQKNVECFHSVQ